MEYPAVGNKTMRLHILHDDRRFERYEPLMEELITQGITDYEIVRPEIDPTKQPFENINLAHKALVRMAKEKGMEEICIAEDDVMFTHPTAWKYFLENKPKEYTVYVAATYIMPPSLNLLTGFQLYMVHHSFYDQFLSVPNPMHIDNAICDLKSNHKICYPFAALQRPGYSANHPGETVNYNIGCGIKEHDLYKG